MKKAMILCLLVIILGSLSVSAEGLEVGADLTVSSFTNWNDYTFSALLKSVNAEYYFSRNISAFGSFQFGPTKNDQWVDYDLSKLKVGGQYVFPFDSISLAVRVGFATYNVERQNKKYDLKTSGLFIGGKIESQISKKLGLFGLLDFSPMAKAIDSNDYEADAAYSALELGVEYSFDRFQVIGGLRSQGIIDEDDDKWGDGGLFFGAKTAF